jgi:tetratricopeptide (TPR) repeat protein
MAAWFRRSITAEQFQAEVVVIETKLAASDIAGAERLSRALLARVEKRNGPGSVLWADARFLLGRIFFAAGDHETALEHMQAAASLVPSSADETKKKLTFDMNLGDLLGHLGRLDEAEDVLTKSLAIRREFYGVEHAGHGYGAESLATLCLQQEKYEQALELGKQAAEAFRPGDPALYFSAVALSLLAEKGLEPDADVLARLEKTDRDGVLPRLVNGGRLAIVPWVGLLWNAHQHLEGRSDSVALRESCLSTIANLSQTLGAHADRIRALEALVAIPRQRSPEERAFFLQALALALDQAGRKEDAIATYKAAEDAASTAGPEARARIKRNYATFLFHRGDVGHAESELSDALQLVQGTTGEEVGRVHAAMGILLHHDHRWGEVLVEHLSAAVSLLPPTHPDALMSAAHLEFARQKKDCDCATGMRSAMADAVRAVVLKYVPANLVADIRIPATKDERVQIDLNRRPTKDEKALLELATVEARKLILDRMQELYGPAPAA